jgi:protein-S-isoprenylcysteine O-methyltransferase Ste14
MWADQLVIAYGAAVWLTSHLFVTFYEEPTLGRTFGQEYAEFRSHVPRWIPRIRPWTPGNVSH